MTLLKRWATFNAVGAMGVVVQLGLFSVLVRWSGLNYLAATAISVEGAVLHNFVWHQHWTWRDRPAATLRDVALRLARFHLANGALSLVGNLALMATLAGALGVDPVLANIAAIAGCSLVNFVTGTTLVFRTAAVMTVAVVLGTAAPVSAEPSGDALKAWTAYDAVVAARYSAALGTGNMPFFV